MITQKKRYIRVWSGFLYSFSAIAVVDSLHVYGNSITKLNANYEKSKRKKRHRSGDKRNKICVFAGYLDQNAGIINSMGFTVLSTWYLNFTVKRSRIIGCFAYRWMFKAFFALNDIYSATLHSRERKRDFASAFGIHEAQIGANGDGQFAAAHPCLLPAAVELFQCSAYSLSEVIMLREP